MQEYVSTPDNELVIIDDIIPREAHIRPGYVVEEKKYVVIHNTGNYGEECDAASHADYLREQAMSSSPREASWHYTVDDKRVYCHIPDNESAWHAGDGTFGEGNYYGIGIEICVNGFPLTYEGEEYEQWLERFRRAVDNAARLTSILLEKYGLDSTAIRQHYDFSPEKKNCPMQMRYKASDGTFTRDDGDMWTYFLERVDRYTAYRTASRG